MKTLKEILLSGKKVFPLIEGGKGINATDGISCGAWARENCVGTFSAVSPDFYDEKGNVLGYHFEKKNRKERHLELIEMVVKGAVAQAKKAYETSKGKGAIHMNMLWGIADSHVIIERILQKVHTLIDGVVCGAGMPFQLGEIATKYQTYYYPIVSCSRTFQILWKRSFKNYVEYLGGVVYEDPWLAGGHNGLTNAEDPNIPENPYERVKALREFMNSVGLQETPIILAGGIWSLEEFQNYIDNKDLGKIAFQFGTRPLITKESPVSEIWKKALLKVKQSDIISQRFSPTGFYSSAIKNLFLKRLIERTHGEIPYKAEKDDIFTKELQTSKTQCVYVKPEDFKKAEQQLKKGLTNIVKTPDGTVVFISDKNWNEIKEDRKNCSGCLGYCAFSGWCASKENNSTGKIPDPRKYCIQKTLYSIGHGGSIKENLLFAGSVAYKFASDILYKAGKIPSTKELIETLKSGK
ncbi:MAG: nitronate monooxygenase [Alphaproteobacteria bacterium]|nr:nitronate monooxygenase [Alphaproteobacteria bacterium]